MNESSPTIHKLLPVLVAVGIALALGVWLLRPGKAVPAAAVSAVNSTQGGPRIIIEGQALEAVALAPSVQMNAVLPEHITLSMIQAIREQGGRKLLVFTDGSQLEASPYLMAQLPAELRLRLEYTREKGQ